MLFTSLTYILFLVLVFGLYWSLGRRAQNILLLVAGYTFYGWWDWRFCSLMLFSSAWDFFAARRLHESPSPYRRRAWLASGVSVNLAILGFFKYWNFFAENLHAAASSLGWSLSPATLNVILPVGISFYTFQSISYLIDVYRRTTEPCPSALEYFTFVAFFPQLMAGPIERARHMLPQFAAPRRFDPDQARDGCRQILWGFFKKLVIADQLSPIVEAYYSDPSAATGGQLLIATLAFTFQIYCDFSAYSDIALGSARLLGFDLMRNFDAPYLSASPQQFWRRWHISLSTWFRDYVYIPLGGSRVGRARQAVNVLATFLISGLWHGASWNFVAWGGLHGAVLAIPVLLGFAGTSDSPAHQSGLRQIVGIAATFTFVSFAWILFRAADLSSAWLVMKKIATTPWTGASSALYVSPLGVRLPAFIGFLLAAEWLQRRQPHPLTFPAWPRPVRWAFYLPLVWSILLWGPAENGQFIYFQF